MTGRVTLILFLILLSVVSKAQTTPQTGRDFAINVPDSNVELFVSSSAGDVNGVFNTWTGAFHQASAGVPESATLSLSVKADSMSTGSELKDKIVKGKAFLYVHHFPTVSFVSTMVIPSGALNTFQIQGNFTLRGATKPVVLQLTLDRDGKGGGQVYADLSFDPREFEMPESVPPARVSDPVRVRLNLHFTPAPVAGVKERYSWAKAVRITTNQQSPE